MSMKSENTIYHVVPAGERWQVGCEGGSPSYYYSEAEAIAAARELAKDCAPGHVVIHKVDGSIEEEHLIRMDKLRETSRGMVQTDGKESRRSDDQVSDRNATDKRRRQDGYSQQNGAPM